MVAKGDIVLLDTNVIIEAHRAKCWNAIVRCFRLETVEMCCVEVATGDRRRPGYVAVDVEQLRSQVAVHEASKKELARLETSLSAPWSIDPGEKHLLAHAVARPGAWHLSASDRAAVIAAHELGLLDRFVSLETLARSAGLNPQLKRHFTETWLSLLRTQFLMGGPL